MKNCKVTIEELRIGDVVVAKIQKEEEPHEDVRPVLVMKKSGKDGTSKSVVVFPLTSSLKSAFMPARVFLPAEGTGLPIDSMALCDKPVTILQESICRKAGSLTEYYFSMVCKEALESLPFDRFSN